MVSAMYEMKVVVSCTVHTHASVTIPEKHNYESAKVEVEGNLQAK